ncbi:hypothetical protein IPL85_05745 [Candidatus Saccharibacteria bacterium]|nr:MAG: hypothetical protein IPL85_05745 [Candidatus Saccharibacteria bacterium]
MPLSSQQKLLVIVLSVVSIVAIGLQIPTISQQKAKASDQQKSQDIATLHSSIDTYNSSRNSLPKTLSDLKNIDDTKDRLDDYKYSPSQESYKLCATFKTDTTKDTESSYTAYSSSYNSDVEADPYKHGKGNKCFTYEVSSYGGRYFDTFDSSSYPSDSTNSSSSSSIQDNANDAQRKSDINAVRSYIEASYAQNGYYPTLAEINNTTWRTTNMKGLDTTNLIDPEGVDNRISNTPGTNRYSYQPKTASGKTCEIASECTTFTVTATLSNGDLYTKSSL